MKPGISWSCFILYFMSSIHQGFHARNLMQLEMQLCTCIDMFVVREGHTERVGRGFDLDENGTFPWATGYHLCSDLAAKTRLGNAGHLGFVFNSRSFKLAYETPPPMCYLCPKGMLLVATLYFILLTQLNNSSPIIVLSFLEGLL